MTERVVVIIVNCNGLKHLRRCLPALLAQEKVAFETIIVDNSSTDGSVAWLQTNYSTVQPIRKVENRDFAKVNNQGIQATTGEYVVLLNNDTQPTPGWLTGLVAVAVCDERLPDAGN